MTEQSAPAPAVPPADAAAMPDALGEPGDGSAFAEPGVEPGTPVFAAADRPRGLNAWFAPGGEDEAPPERVADERRLLRLLLLMIVILVGVPTLLTMIAFVGQLIARVSGG